MVKENDEHIVKMVQTLGREGMMVMAEANDDIIDENNINLKIVINIHPKLKDCSWYFTKFQPFIFSRTKSYAS